MSQNQQEGLSRSLGGGLCCAEGGDSGQPPLGASRRKEGLPPGEMSQAERRQTIWAQARDVRRGLTRFATQREVARHLGITQQAVERIELTALAKVIARMKDCFR